jgi:hypothetical protein
MPERLNELLADGATALVQESFTGVAATWWWERRVGGAEVRRAIAEELGLEDAEPVVLTFEISGETETGRAAALLAERSARAEGLASGLYRRIEEKLEANLGGP